MSDTDKPTPYRAYDLMTGEEVGRYENEAMAYVKNPDKPITVIYRPSKRKKK